VGACPASESFQVVIVGEQARDGVVPGGWFVVAHE
jgi:hypothetical protein